VILIYIGIFASVIAYYVNISSLLQRFIENVGIFMIFTGVLLIFTYRIERKMERLRLFWEETNKVGLVDIRILRPDYLDHIFSRLSETGKIHIIINSSQITRDISTSVCYLIKHIGHRKATVIFAGMENQHLNDIAHEIKVGSPIAIALDLSVQIKELGTSRVELYFLKNDVFQTMVMSELRGILIIPCESAEEESIAVTFDERSSLLRHYKTHFNDMLEGSEKYTSSAGNQR
jgi:hypothetical protein